MLVHILFLLATAITIRPTCGLYHAPEERKLALAIVLTRHGDRAPLYSFPSDRLPLKKWPSGPGGLTPAGARAMYRLGERLREHYIHQLEFLDKTYNRKDVYVRSSDTDRTLMSAYSLLYGMFPVGSGDIHEVGNWYSFFPKPASHLGLPNRAQPVAIRSAEHSMDGVLIPGGWCPRHDRLQQVKRATRTWINRQHMETELLVQLTHAANNVKHLLLQDTLKIADTWFCQKSHGVGLPPNGDHLLYRARLAAEWVRNYTNHGNEAHRLRSGLLLHEISKRLRLAHHVNTQHEHHSVLHLHSKFVLLSAHDSTIAAALAAMGQFDGRQPSYNSTLIWELHTHKHNNHDATVRILYNGKPVRIHGCQHVKHDSHSAHGHGHSGHAYGSREQPIGDGFCKLHDYLHATRHVTVRSHAQRYRECLTGIVRMGAEMLHWFVPEPLDEDDVGRMDETHGGLVLFIMLLMTMAGVVAAKTYDSRHGYLDSWRPVPQQQWTQAVAAPVHANREKEDRLANLYKTTAPSPGMLS